MDGNIRGECMVGTHGHKSEEATEMVQGGKAQPGERNARLQ